jgi:hypothetical protein
MWQYLVVVFVSVVATAAAASMRPTLLRFASAIVLTTFSVVVWRTLGLTAYVGLIALVCLMALERTRRQAALRRVAKSSVLHLAD